MTINPTPENPDYQHLLVEIQQRIRSAQYAALKAVNQKLIALYWDIGKSIVNQQQTAGWGKVIVEQLASDIRTEFPGISGFSARNVWNMRHFYQTYSQNEKLQPMVAEIRMLDYYLFFCLRPALGFRWPPRSDRFSPSIRRC
jgi:DUF1016 N-terminal domain